MILTDTHGQTGLPRYFARVFAITSKINKGRLDFVLPDGRIFRATGAHPGPVGEVHLHNTDVFARLIARGTWAFATLILMAGGPRPTCNR